MTVSETFPSFFIGKNPERRVIEVSYGDSLARKFGRANKQKLEEFGEELFGIKLPRDNASVTDWGIEGHRGGMISAGIGGPITGEGADLLIIDDPIKNRQEANSKTYREMIWNEWQNTLLTRLHPDGAVILIMTRWHEDDLAGRLIKQMKEDPKADRWDIVSLPAIAEENDLLGRAPGEPLWPERYSKEKLESIKTSVGSYVWSALFQQNPRPQEGGIFRREWWKFYRQTPNHFDEIIQSWDMSFKETTSGSYVVGQVWGRIGADKYLLDQIRDRMDFPATVQAVRTLSAKWPQANAKLVENKANGPAVVSTLKNEIAGLIEVEPQGGKEARAAAVSSDIEAGNVYLPDPSIAPWIHDFIEESCAFPTGANDDQVDAMTQALLRLRNSSVKLW